MVFLVSFISVNTLLFRSMNILKSFLRKITHNQGPYLRCALADWKKLQRKIGWWLPSVFTIEFSYDKIAFNRDI